MSKVYAVNYYLRGFGHATYRVTNALDALDAAIAVMHVLKSVKREHIKDFSINEVKEAPRVGSNGDHWPVIDAKEQNG